MHNNIEQESNQSMQLDKVSKNWFINWVLGTTIKMAKCVVNINSTFGAQIQHS